MQNWWRSVFGVRQGRTPRPYHLEVIARADHGIVSSGRIA